jgi:hypothetical protein
MVEQGLLEILQTNSAITALVNTANGQGVYWVLAPKNASVPYIVLSRVTTQDTQAFQGSLGFRGALFQVDCYGITYYQSRKIAAAVRGILEGYHGTLPDADATSVASILTTKDWDMPYEEGGKGFIYQALLEFRVWYRSAV